MVLCVVVTVFFHSGEFRRRDPLTDFSQPAVCLCKCMTKLDSSQRVHDREKVQKEKERERERDRVRESERARERARESDRERERARASEIFCYV